MAGDGDALQEDKRQQTQQRGVSINVREHKHFKMKESQPWSKDTDKAVVSSLRYLKLYCNSEQVPLSLMLSLL